MTKKFPRKKSPRHHPHQAHQRQILLLRISRRWSAKQRRKTAGTSLKMAASWKISCPRVWSRTRRSCDSMSKKFLSVRIYKCDFRWESPKLHLLQWWTSHGKKLSSSLQMCNSEDDFESRFEAQRFSLERPEKNFVFYVKMTVEQSSCRWERFERWEASLKAWFATWLEIFSRVEHRLYSKNLHGIRRTFNEYTYNLTSSCPDITATPSQPKVKKFYLFQVTIYFSIKYISVFDFL